MKRILLVPLAFLTAFTVMVLFLYFTGVSASAAALDGQHSAAARVLVLADSHGSATPTPFQPIGPTQVPASTLARPTLNPTNTPTLAPMPTFDGPVPERVNILVLGSDQRSDPSLRTDVIMLVSIDTSNAQVSVISFPRDLYVTIPGWMDQRINTAFQVGGFPTLADTIQANFHVRPQYYLLTNFAGFAGIINSLNGIAVQVAQPLTDKCDLPHARAGYCTVEPGKVIMDGQMALWYIRSRHSSSDFDRTRRAQEVLYAMFTRLMKFNAVLRLPALYTQYKESVETNITVSDILPFLPTASRVVADPGSIHRYAVTPQMVSDYITPEGAMVLLPNYYAINSMIQQALSGR